MLSFPTTPYKIQPMFHCSLSKLFLARAFREQAKIGKPIQTTRYLHHVTENLK